MSLNNLVEKLAQDLEAVSGLRDETKRVEAYVNFMEGAVTDKIEKSLRWNEQVKAACELINGYEALFTIGKGLDPDMGYAERNVLPIYEG